MNGNLAAALYGSSVPDLAVPLYGAPAATMLRMMMSSVIDVSRSLTPTNSGYLIMSYARDVGALNICAGMDSDADFEITTDLRRNRCPIAWMHAALGPYYKMTDAALDEGRAMGIPDTYLSYCATFIASETPREKVGGVAVLITLLTLTQLMKERSNVQPPAPPSPNSSFPYDLPFVLT